MSVRSFLQTRGCHAAMSIGIGLLASWAPFAVASSGPDGFSAALQRAQVDASTPFSLEVRCFDEKGIRSFVLYPSGALIWNGQRQARADAALRGALLDDLASAGFAAFEPLYGGDNKPGEAKAPLQVRCRVAASVDGHSKASGQATGGEQFTPLLELAGSLIDRTARVGAAGVTAPDLGSALSMLAEGALAPETLSLRLTSFATDARAEPGVILRIDGGRRARTAYRPGEAADEPEWQAADAAEITRAARALVEHGFASLPFNVPGPGVQDIEVTVLGHRHTVTARAFSRIGTGELVEEGERFAKLVETLLR